MNDDEARSRVREAGGYDLLERLDHLDVIRNGNRRQPVAPPAAPDRGAAPDFDVALAGGGLWSLLAPILAARGLKVAVIERTRAGSGHREWNASRPELGALTAAGLLSDAEVERLVLARYRECVCRFHRGGTYPVGGVLDHAVDAAGLLALARSKGEALGVDFLDGHTVVTHAAGPDAVVLRTRTGGIVRDVIARVMVDARGAASPAATADLVCPTVGGVLRGLSQGDAPDQIDPAVGEILVTNEPIQEGRQHVWEAFPGRHGETTVYLFHYATRAEPVSLAHLYARFFTSVAGYKRGDAQLVRPTFGLIPGWSRLSAAPAPPYGPIILVGDAAARHSPLTYCGFGATLRSLAPAADAVVRLLTRPGGAPLACAVDDAPLHALTGALAFLMASRSFSGDELNALLDAAFHTLHESGPGPYAALLRDEMRAKAFARFLGETARRHPAVWSKVIRGMGIGLAARWGLGLARSLCGGA